VPLVLLLVLVLVEDCTSVHVALVPIVRVTLVVSDVKPTEADTNADTDADADADRLC
jgi:hypothetical protein